MPQERIYQQQVGPAQPVALPNASPASFGAGVGQGMAELGGAMHRSDLQAYQAEREQTRGAEWSDFQANYARLREEADRQEVDARASMQPGGKGYAETRAKWLEARSAALLDGITEDSVRRQGKAQLDEFGGRVRAEAYQVETGARIGKRTSDVQVLYETSANRVDRDPSKYQEELLATLTAVEGMNDIPGDVREKLHRAAEEKLAVGVLNGTMRDNPRAAQALIQSGAFDKVLSNDQLQQLRNRGEILIHREQIDAERINAQAGAAQKEREATILKQVGDGVELDPAVLNSAADAAKGRGDTSREYELRAAATGMRLAAPYANANAQQLTGAIATIETDREWRKDPAKVAQHGWLDKRRTMIREADPAIAAPNWNDAGSVTAFEQAVRTDADQRGQGEPKYLTRDMETSLKPMLGTVGGRAEVLELINRMSPGAAVSAARQLAPDDRAFQGAAMLRDPVRRIVLSGQEALKTGATPVKPARTALTYNQFAAPALKAFEGDTGRMVKETADAIAAELASRRGATVLTSDLYLEAMHLALGGGTRGGEPTGGLGWWQNGNGRGVRLVLPENMTQREFDARLARMSGPIDAQWNGKPITPDDLRRHFTPVAVDDGVYEMEDARGRPLKAKNGRDVTFRFGFR